MKEKNEAWRLKERKKSMRRGGGDQKDGNSPPADVKF
jgi:hypothetical protein